MIVKTFKPGRDPEAMAASNAEISQEGNILVSLDYGLGNQADRVITFLDAERVECVAETGETINVWRADHQGRFVEDWR